jgi:predicted ATP-grasp superfamily ATP-dependent carboligase
LLEFPVVIKPRFAYEWRKKGVWEKVGERKAVLVDSFERFEKEYRKLAAVTSEVLVQEFIPGDDTDVVVCCCYIGRDGELLGHYTARKLIQSPPLLGTACIVELADIPELVDGSIRLLRAYGYAGMAEIEYKHDKRAGAYFLIEVNPRHWDQHELGTCAGINLTWSAYNDLTGRRLRPISPSYNRRKCRWIAERELALLLMRAAYRWIADLLRADHLSGSQARPEEIGKISLGDLVRLFSGRKIFAIFHRYDPIPGLLLCSHLIREIANSFPIFPSRSFSKAKSD